MGRTVLGPNRDKNLDQFCVPIQWRGKTFWCRERDRPHVGSVLYLASKSQGGAEARVKAILPLLSKRPIEGLTPRPLLQ